MSINVAVVVFGNFVAAHVIKDFKSPFAHVLVSNYPSFLIVQMELWLFNVPRGDRLIPKMAGFRECFQFAYLK